MELDSSVRVWLLVGSGAWKVEAGCKGVGLVFMDRDLQSERWSVQWDHGEGVTWWWLLHRNGASILGRFKVAAGAWSLALDGDAF